MYDHPNQQWIVKKTTLPQMVKEADTSGLDRSTGPASLRRISYNNSKL